MEYPDQSILVGNLRQALAHYYGIAVVQMLETHISYVLLTGQYAYKIKKSIKLAFLDFSTLERRHFFCLEEVRLNARCAPHIYIDVLAIGGTPQDPKIGGSGSAIEYAVFMHEFPQNNLLSRMVGCGECSGDHVDALAARLAEFHGTCSQASADSDFGNREHILKWALDNFLEISSLGNGLADNTDLTQLQQWTQSEFNRLSATFTQRKIDGCIREGHGDLHLGNVAVVDNMPVFFDCIEFNADLRWIDVMSEAAFLVVDMQAHNRPDFAYRLLNAYLEASTDYGGIAVLRFYAVYRLMVRAKVSLMSKPAC